MEILFRCRVLPIYAYIDQLVTEKNDYAHLSAVIDLIQVTLLQLKVSSMVFDCSLIWAEWALCSISQRISRWDFSNSQAAQGYGTNLQISSLVFLILLIIVEVVCIAWTAHSIFAYWWNDFCNVQIYHAGSEVLNMRKARLLATAVKRIVRHQDCRFVCVAIVEPIFKDFTLNVHRYNFPVLAAVESYLSDLLIVDHDTLLARSMKLEPPYRYV